jgi:hypothetical protein
VKYVRRELRRWQDASPERIVPPNVEFAWPTPRPDAQAYFESATATGSYLEWRLALPSQDEAWVSGLRLRRWGFGFARDPRCDRDSCWYADAARVCRYPAYAAVRGWLRVLEPHPEVV